MGVASDLGHLKEEIIRFDSDEDFSKESVEFDLFLSNRKWTVIAKLFNRLSSNITIWVVEDCGSLKEVGLVESCKDRARFVER